MIPHNPHVLARTYLSLSCEPPQNLELGRRQNGEVGNANAYAPKKGTRTLIPHLTDNAPRAHPKPLPTQLQPLSAACASRRLAALGVLAETLRAAGTLYEAEK